MIESIFKVESPNFKNCFNLIYKREATTDVRGNPVVAKLVQTIESHRLSKARLLSVVPKTWSWNLATISNPDMFSSAITAEVLDWFAESFAIRKSWLEDGTKEIYLPFWGYKNTPELIRSLKSEAWNREGLRMSILAEDYTHKYGFHRRYMIVFSVPQIHGFSGSTIYKHKPFEWEWNYLHPPCIRDTVTMANWVREQKHTYPSIPIFPVKRGDFENLISGRAFISDYWTTRVGALDRLEHLKVFSSDRAV